MITAVTFYLKLLYFTEAIITYLIWFTYHTYLPNVQQLTPSLMNLLLSAL